MKKFNALLVAFMTISLTTVSNMLDRLTVVNAVDSETGLSFNLFIGILLAIYCYMYSQ